MIELQPPSLPVIEPVFGEFDQMFGCFLGFLGEDMKTEQELVGMTTRARVMDCIGTLDVDALRMFSVRNWQQVPSPRSAVESLR